LDRGENTFLTHVLHCMLRMALTLHCMSRWLRCVERCQDSVSELQLHCSWIWQQPGPQSVHTASSSLKLPQASCLRTLQYICLLQSIMLLGPPLDSVPCCLILVAGGPTAVSRQLQVHSSATLRRGTRAPAQTRSLGIALQSSFSIC